MVIQGWIDDNHQSSFASFIEVPLHLLVLELQSTGILFLLRTKNKASDGILKNSFLFLLLQSFGVGERQNEKKFHNLLSVYHFS